MRKAGRIAYYCRNRAEVCTQEPVAERVATTETQHSRMLQGSDLESNNQHPPAPESVPPPRLSRSKVASRAKVRAFQYVDAEMRCGCNAACRTMHISAWKKIDRVPPAIERRRVLQALDLWKSIGAKNVCSSKISPVARKHLRPRSNASNGNSREPTSGRRRLFLGRFPCRRLVLKQDWRCTMAYDGVHLAAIKSYDVPVCPSYSAGQAQGNAIPRASRVHRKTFASSSSRKFT